MRTLLPAVLIALLALTASASADVTSISVRSMRDLGTFAGKPYRGYIESAMSDGRGSSAPTARAGRL